MYVALTCVFGPFAYGPLQIRPAEALCLLPLFFPETVPALYIGCMLANLFSGYGAYDIFIGSAVTLLAAVCTYLIGKVCKKTWVRIAVGGLFPVLLNALLLPLIWEYCYGAAYVYHVQVAFLLIGQSVSVYAVGVPLVLRFKNIFKKLI
jgi:uncharacterized membrane protein